MRGVVPGALGEKDGGLTGRCRQSGSGNKLGGGMGRHWLHVVFLAPRLGPGRTEENRNEEQDVTWGEVNKETCTKVKETDRGEMRVLYMRTKRRVAALLSLMIWE